jgi:hypothetical protein
VAPVDVETHDRKGGYVLVQGALSVGELVVDQPRGLSPGKRVEVSVAEGGVI